MLLHVYDLKEQRSRQLILGSPFRAAGVSQNMVVDEVGGNWELRSEAFSAFGIFQNTDSSKHHNDNENFRGSYNCCM